MGERFTLHYYSTPKEVMAFLNRLNTESTVAAIYQVPELNNYAVIIDTAGIPTWHLWTSLARFLRREKVDD